MKLSDILNEKASLEVDTNDTVKVAPDGTKLEQIIINFIKDALSIQNASLKEKQKRVLSKVNVKNEVPFDVQVEAMGSFYRITLNPESGEKPMAARINKTKLETMTKSKDYSGMLEILLKEQF